MYEKPLPVIDPESQPYWDALKQHRLLLKRCRACQRSHHYPRELCPHCHSDDLEWTDASGKGEIYSYTIARKPAGPVFAADVPYVIAMIALDEGPRMMTNLIDIEPTPETSDAEVSVVKRDLAGVAIDTKAPALSDDEVLAQIAPGRPSRACSISRSISSKARITSHLYIITSLAPPNSEGFSTAKQPVTWKNGTDSRLAFCVGAPADGVRPAGGAGASLPRRRESFHHTAAIA